MGIFVKKVKTVEELEEEKMALEIEVEEKEAKSKVQNEISELESRGQATSPQSQSAGSKFKQGLMDAREKFMESQRRKAEERARNPQPAQSQQPQTNPFGNMGAMFGGGSPMRNQRPQKQQSQTGGMRFGNVLSDDKPINFGNPLSDRPRKRSKMPMGMTIGDVFGGANMFAQPKKVVKKRKKRRSKSKRKK